MIGRIIASITFVAGGVGAWFVMAILRGFAASQAGMSAVAISGPSLVEVIIPYLVCFYFLVSAIGIVVCRKRESLRGAALFAHLLLLVVFFAMCSEGIGKGSENFMAGVLLLSVITLLFFSPWLIVWSVFLFRRG